MKMASAGHDIWILPAVMTGCQTRVIVMPVEAPVYVIARTLCCQMFSHFVDARRS